MHFARLLRRAGLPVGPADMLAAQQALTLVDIGSRAQVRTALRTSDGASPRARRRCSTTPSRCSGATRKRRKAAAALGADGPASSRRRSAPPPGSRRLAEAMAAGREQPPKPEETAAGDRRGVHRLASSERLQTMDFEAMSADGDRRAPRREIRKLTLPLDLRRTRRRRPDPTGPHVDLRATIRSSLRQGGEILRDRAPAARVTRPPPLVVLCDISGSMSRYAQILLHFLHAVANDRDRVSVFLFGTRLSNITRQLRHRDPEVGVPDGGATRCRTGPAAPASARRWRHFNRDWARRVLGQGAVVLLVTDGLDREGAQRSGREHGAAAPILLHG